MVVAAAAVKVVWIWYLASRLHEEIHTSAGSEKRIGSDDNNFPPLGECWLRAYRWMFAEVVFEMLRAQHQQWVAAKLSDELSEQSADRFGASACEVGVTDMYWYALCTSCPTYILHSTPPLTIATYFLFSHLYSVFVSSWHKPLLCVSIFYISVPLFFALYGTTTNSSFVYNKSDSDVSLWRKAHLWQQVQCVINIIITETVNCNRADIFT